jgi:hypothetical protein
MDAVRCEVGMSLRLVSSYIEKQVGFVIHRKTDAIGAVSLFLGSFV